MIADWNRSIGSDDCIVVSVPVKTYLHKSSVDGGYHLLVPTKASDAQVAEYQRLRGAGRSQSMAATAVGLSASWGASFERAERERRMGQHLNATDEMSPAELLHDPAAFGQAYLGHMPVPWTSEMDDRVSQLLATPNREFLIFNLPPGAGKSTWWLRFVVRQIALNRRLRWLQGAKTQLNAAKATGRVRSWLEAQVPVYAPPELVAKGLACQPWRVLSEDFGRFKPEAKGALWRRDAWTVEYADDAAQAEKEATATAYGADSDVIGNRADLIGWDDLVVEDNTRSATALETLIEKWDGGMGESRLEPFGAGLLVLFGQRIGPRDLYRYNLDKTYVELVDGQEVERRKYTHFVMPAHFEDVCVGVHDRATARSWPHGCLLDAARLPWTGPDGLDAKRRSSPRAYEVQYQQREGTGDGALVESAFVYGGADSEGVDRPGCLNRNRLLGQVPAGWTKPLHSVVTVDPSGTNFWGIQWWVCSPEHNARALMRLHNRRMTADQLLDFNGDKFIGILDDLWHESMQVGAPIERVVVEINAAQRYLTQFHHAKKWRETRKVAIVSHTTHRNKLDPNLGVSIMVEPFRQGWFDLPYGDVAARGATATLANQLTTSSDRNDQLMACWFMELDFQRVRSVSRVLPRLPRPSWQRRAS